MKTRRGAVFGVIALAVLIAWIAQGRTWFALNARDQSGAALTSHLSSVLVATALAGLALSLMLHGPARTRMTGVVALVGLAMVVLGLVASTAYRGAATRLSGGVLDGSFTRWPLRYGLAGGLLAGASVILAWLERGGVARPGPSAAEDLSLSSADAWKAMDAGRDPTLEVAGEGRIGATLSEEESESTDLSQESP